jgi:hypothetical protein
VRYANPWEPLFETLCATWRMHVLTADAIRCDVKV